MSTNTISQFHSINTCAYSYQSVLCGLCKINVDNYHNCSVFSNSKEIKFSYSEIHNYLLSLDAAMIESVGVSDRVMGI